MIIQATNGRQEVYSTFDKKLKRTRIDTRNPVTVIKPKGNDVDRFFCRSRSDYSSNWALDTAQYSDGPDGYWAPDLFQEFWGLPDWALGPNTPYIEMARDTEKFRAWLREVRASPLPRFYLDRCWACQHAHSGDDTDDAPNTDDSLLPKWYISHAAYQDGPDGYWEPERFRNFWKLPRWAAGHNLPYLTIARHPERFQEWLLEIRRASSVHPTSEEEPKEEPVDHRTATPDPASESEDWAQVD